HNVHTLCSRHKRGVQKTYPCCRSCRSCEGKANGLGRRLCERLRQIAADQALGLDDFWSVTRNEAQAIVGIRRVLETCPFRQCLSRSRAMPWCSVSSYEICLVQGFYCASGFMSEKPATIFLHIPKTGGTSFVSVLTRQFPREACYHTDGTLAAAEEQLRN